MDRIIFRVEYFEAYGLNKYRNFLRSNKYYFTEDHQLYDFMCEMLNVHTCENCAIFAIDWYGGMWCGIKTEDENNMELLGSETFEVDWFARLDADYLFTCYALMIETRPGEWTIIDN